MNDLERRVMLLESENVRLRERLKKIEDSLVSSYYGFSQALLEVYEASKVYEASRVYEALREKADK